ncbi:MAG: 1-acyl-sn-glycerol-3-phosphate acyltransferase [Deltaproteobacteria bacterium]|nr:1-acyl-sn-glycerol-3-phosphate acyltransferase [Deltaproteobacteria bacterium]
MSKLKILLGSVLYWVYFCITMFLFFIAVLTVRIVTAPFDANRRTILNMVGWHGRSYINIVPGWTVKVTGLERLDPKQTYVFASNHASMADAVLMFYVDHPFVAVAKLSLFQVPVLGWTLYLAGFLPVKRGDKQSAERLMAEAKRVLLRGTSVFLFAEGTRSEDGRLRTFKHGAFSLSRETGLPLVPVVIRGSHLIARKDSNSIAASERIAIEIEILEMLRPEQFESTEALMQETRERIRIALGPQGEPASDTPQESA